MERETNAMQTRCRGGCGFYGSTATDGLCSVCFKEALRKKQQQPTNGLCTPHPLHSQEKREPSTSKSNQAEAGNSSPANVEDPEKLEGCKNSKKKIRCSTCHKKVGLTGFKCRCGGTYCGIHRYTDEHGCTFDYRALGAQEIRKNNPVVAGEKVKKI